MRSVPFRIPAPLYKKILTAMPIPYVDVIVVSRGKFLMGKRRNKPAQGQWWFVGGRVMKGERLMAAAKRHVLTEIGIKNVIIKKQLGTGETMFKNSAQGPASHTINIVFLAEVRLNKDILPANPENSEMRWFSKIEKRWPPYVKEMLRKVGFQ